MSILVLDIGTTGLRASVVQANGLISNLHYERCAPNSPFPGLVEFDATAMKEAILRVTTATMSATTTPIDAIGITTQRASTIAWDHTSGQPIGPALSWQDLRTVGECISAKIEHSLTLAPNQTATKASWMLKNYPVADRKNIRIGTVDTWAAYVLSQGALHVTDHSNAAVTGLLDPLTQTWSPRILALMGVEEFMLPTVVPSSAVIGHATALAGNPPIASMVGDQQGSLIGQGCIVPGKTKITFGTGAMLDIFTGSTSPLSAQRSSGGTFPIISYSDAHNVYWGVEAIMLSAGTNIDWLCNDMAMIDSPQHSHEVASQCATTDGVVYVPALLGLGTPHWDYGARGSLFGITRGSTRHHIVRAVLEGIAHRGTDLIDAAQIDSGLVIDSVRIDGGMSTNSTFVQALADASQRTIEVSPVTEATTLGAAFLAGVAVGTWKSLTEATQTWTPRQIITPQSTLDRNQWAEAIRRSAGWIPELSALDF